MSEGVSPKASRYAAAKRLMCRIPRPTATATDRGGIAAGSLEGLAETVDHHLRTPLTVIQGHVELMTDSEQELPAEVHQSLACVLSAGRQLNEVVVGICELFDVACVDPNAVEVVDVSKLVRTEIATSRPRAALRGVRVVTDGDPAATCVADSARLGRALRELLDNA